MHDSAKGNRDHLLALGQTLALDTEAAAVVGLLQAAGIPNLVLRGPSIVRRLYSDPEARDYVDVDLLVPARQFAEAEAILEDASYAESRLEAAFGDLRPGHAHGWLSPTGREIDLHRTLIGVGAPPNEVWPALAAGAEEMAVAGETVQVPSLPALALIVGLHAGHHLGRVEHAARDLELALIQFPQTVWADAVALARRLDATGEFVAGLQSQLPGCELLRRLGAQEPDRPHRELAGDRAYHLANDLASLRATPGAWAKVAFVRERLLPDPRTLESSSRLARRGRAGLWLAYGGRLLSALRRVPRALAGLRASTRRDG